MGVTGFDALTEGRASASNQIEHPSQHWLSPAGLTAWQQSLVAVSHWTDDRSQSGKDKSLTDLLERQR